MPSTPSNPRARIQDLSCRIGVEGPPSPVCHVLQSK